MVKISDYRSDDPIAWCPGCGNFGILDSLKQALSELEIKSENLLLVSGIGQASKLPHYLRCNMFNGLHGRTLPVATGAKIANHRLVVIAVGGDGDGYAEGGNHFIHAMRRNVNLSYLVHNNQIYGLTKGQSSPTTDEKTMSKGVHIPAEKPLALAVASNCSFVARGFSGEKSHLIYLIKEAIKNNGFSLLDILQPCITFNKINTYKWYKDRIYKIEEQSYDPYDRNEAFNKALEWGEKIPVGIIFKSQNKTYEDIAGLTDSVPLVERKQRKDILERLVRDLY